MFVRVTRQICTGFVGVSVYANDTVDAVTEAFESVLNDMPSNFFFGIYIDGPISERLGEVIHRYSQASNVLVLKNQRNEGLSKGINSLIRLSLNYSSDYFFRMDADDVVISGRFQKQLDFMEANPSIDVCGSSIAEFYRGNFSEVDRPSSYRVVPETHKEIYSGLARTATFNHPTVCFRLSSLKSSFGNFEIYDEAAGLAEDYKLWVDLAALGFKFANINEPLLAFRVTEDFYKRRSSMRAIAELRVRLYAMKRLRLYSISNLIYAYAILAIRFMPPFIIKMAYKIKRGFGLK